MQIRVIRSVDDLNRVAAAHAATALRQALAAHDAGRLIAATGSSQLGFLDRLVAAEGIDWSRVELFHLDEYIGLSRQHPASFSHFIQERIVGPTGIGRAHLLDGEADPRLVMESVGRHLRRAPVDLAFTGIGENGHLAFNEPPADFDTDEAFRVVELDEISRRQQVGEGWFGAVADVPTHAITMTVRQILKAREIICLAHGARKARAVAACFSGPPTPEAPASALALHAKTTVYLDAEAAALLPPGIAAVEG